MPGFWLRLNEDTTAILSGRDSIAGNRDWLCSACDATAPAIVTVTTLFSRADWGPGVRDAAAAALATVTTLFSRVDWRLREWFRPVTPVTVPTAVDPALINRWWGQKRSDH
ncbi:hypothetical protein GCM10022627_17020 [Haloarcula argentinensis]|uniref:Uncharacterized protein n=1 Tax=Haloarcula argentinensis TaxID=43776 RepID=A0A830FPF8_HALAR|nr:hypothetical protein GCM10009006_02370 [Haloarcula argentinensis]